MLSGEWKFYYPDDGETLEDARIIDKKSILFSGAEYAARAACEWDYANNDGWGSIDVPFDIAVISPKGEVTVYSCEHSPTINHYVREK